MIKGYDHYSMFTIYSIIRYCMDNFDTETYEYKSFFDWRTNQLYSIKDLNQIINN